jgi:hypothetical protein
MGNLPIFVTDGVCTDCCEVQVNLTARNNIFNHCNLMSLTEGYCSGTKCWETENSRYKNWISAAEC